MTLSTWNTWAVPDREHHKQETAVLNLVFRRQGRPAGTGAAKLLYGGLGVALSLAAHALTRLPVFPIRPAQYLFA